MYKRLLIPTLTALLVTTSATAERSPWIHVEVIDGSDGQEKVNVNLPLSLVRVALDVADSESMIPAHVEIEAAQISVSDLRRIWHELRDAGDAELFRSEEKDETVQISQKGGLVHILVTDRKSGNEKVEIEVPGRMIDALFAGEGNNLNVRAALETLDDAFRGDLVRVTDGDNRVRVWVD